MRLGQRGHLLGVDADVVTRVTFEHSPGRSDPRFLDDKSAFDVFVEYEFGGQKGFLGIEVKYHEDLANTAGKHRDRYSEVAAAMGCFSQSTEVDLQKKPLQQIWRDHLLAGSLLLADEGYDRGAFVFLYPSDNERCASALTDYQRHLTNADTFLVWTLESVIKAARDDSTKTNDEKAAQIARLFDVPVKAVRDRM